MIVKRGFKFKLRLWAIIKFAFDLRESSLEQAIVNGVVLEIQPHLQSPVLGALAQSNVNFIIAQSLSANAPYITALKGHVFRCNWDGFSKTQRGRGI